MKREDIFEGLNDKESLELQLDLWVKGESVHNTVRDECCPDFSCCGSALAPKEARERFAKAFEAGDSYVMNEMLGMFLGQMLDNAYIGGLDIPHEC
jgi:hypothetical protein